MLNVGLGFRMMVGVGIFRFSGIRMLMFLGQHGVDVLAGGIIL
jgi:hypothetical protein